MKLSKRHHQIMELLYSQKYTTVSELVTYLNVSSATIRRDLVSLEKEGFLLREHGGAKIKDLNHSQSADFELPIKKKIDIHKQEKINIARYVATILNDGDCIYLDSGSTPAYIYDYIRHKNITIVTNNLFLLDKIKEKDKASVIFGAGTYDFAHHTLNGTLYLDIIKQFQFSHAFIGCSGFNIENLHCTCTSLQSSSYKNHAMQQSKQTFLVADASKKEEEGIICFALSSAFTKILTTPFHSEHLPKNVYFCS
ncbi:DeoR family fructose operon transcriptional repressor [Breznakia sp. PF5-3]|uniref:DeoR/GlpR family DNA-binding transcription regulator n=1 Tax=unclassified Breznakia TaxID=2623764 RepID=UPI00240774A0|nr:MULTISPECIES: DeoR/GlpR family DNA-binding transcription regulator [unclassified Breznakia]MDL2276718.1 DeoR/GlpR family DNA-binding transcription regulator [Breznakia sp. OttesenSCG-928-G09]MDF9824346.1 DeoR family fructose operon transcriptional repressor [Breznakia sp. PM6-1]MDF9835063.1 DeoR family fructose operon transcriptional repressor [Breznakia sp. PF5-3]MDF9837766.1 DeoR family fructose operon transcriptional repressor [Breznakia sp. PFB2-8]MDF9859645.1 DeoR family fructose opero